MKFRKKPVVIEATQWHKLGDVSDADVEVYVFKLPDEPCWKCNRLWSEHGWVRTLEGHHIVCPDDWIITGVKGEKYPCKPDIFELTYDLVEV